MSQRLFLFDLDGTLVDSAPDLAGAMNEMLVARGRPAMPIEALREASGHGGPSLLKAAFGMERTDPGFEDMRLEFLERYSARPARDSQLYPGIEGMLERLAASGFALGVVTNKPQHLAEIVCRHFSLAPRLIVTVGLGPEGTALKPKPDSLLRALRLTGIAPDRALYAGDSTSDGIAARAVPMRSAWVSWGCQPSLPPAGIFDTAADTPDELASWAESCF